MVIACRIFPVFQVKIPFFVLFRTTSCQVTFSLLGNDIGDISFLTFKIVFHCSRFIFSAFIFKYGIPYNFAGGIGTSDREHRTTVHIHSYLVCIEFYILISNNPLSIHISLIVT